jgi:hypothetical protein
MMTIRKPIRRTDRRWPFDSQDSGALAWWRRLPSDRFRDAETLLVGAILENVVLLPGPKGIVVPRLGDAPAAIAAAFSLLPIEDISLNVDIVMTTLLHCALTGNSAAALVLANVLARTDLGHPFATELSDSWYRRQLENSHREVRFSIDEAALVEAIREYYGTAAQRGSA